MPQRSPRERPMDSQRAPIEQPKMGHRAPIGHVTIEICQWSNILTHRPLIERPQCLNECPCMCAWAAQGLPEGGDARHTEAMIGTVSNPPSMVLHKHGKLNNSIGTWPAKGHGHMCQALLACYAGNTPPLKSFICISRPGRRKH